jgi:hypothetical protein
MDMKSPTSLCCEGSAPAETPASVVQPSFHPVVLAVHSLEAFGNTTIFPSQPPTSVLEIAFGPPRYLALERILI